MPKRTLTPADMERYAAMLQSAKAALPEDRYRRLHAAFVATDYAGVRWSVGLKTGRWSRLEQGKWTDATPPERLHLEEDFIAELEGLAGVQPSGAASAAATPPEAGTAPARPTPVPETRPKRDRTPPAPRQLTPTRQATVSVEADWGPAILCIILAVAFAGAAYGRASPPAYGLAALFAILAVVMVLLNSLARRT